MYVTAAPMQGKVSWELHWKSLPKLTALTEYTGTGGKDRIFPRVWKTTLIHIFYFPIDMKIAYEK